MHLASSDPAIFFTASIHVLAASKPSEGSRHLILSLAKDKRLGIGAAGSQGLHAAGGAGSSARGRRGGSAIASQL